eukprot:9623864-Prorocentrum_lima.AAC.1
MASGVQPSQHPSPQGVGVGWVGRREEECVGLACSRHPANPQPHPHPHTPSVFGCCHLAACRVAIWRQQEGSGVERGGSRRELI